MNNQPKKNDEAEKERYLKKAIKQGLDDLKAGRVVDGKKAFSKLHKKLKNS